MIDPSPRSVLDCPMGPNDADAPTIRAYLVALLRAVWHEGEGFSGKRPFGNSGWKHEVYESLVRAGLVEGTFDDDGYLDEMDRPAASALVSAAIEYLGGTVRGSTEGVVA